MAIGLLACLRGGPEGVVNRGRSKWNLPRFSIGVGRVTAPRIRFQGGHHAGLKRVAFDVATGFEEIALGFNRKTVITALPEMAADPIRAAHVEPVASLEVMQGSAEFLRVAGTEEQVNMIGHEAVVMELGLVG